VLLADEHLAERARALEWLLFDVDGVFTDGRLVYGPDGEQWKMFEVRDGLGLKLAQKAGLKVGILSGRVSEALRFRAGELGLDALIMDRSDKKPAFHEFLPEDHPRAGRLHRGRHPGPAGAAALRPLLRPLRRGRRGAGAGAQGAPPSRGARSGARNV
jgi:hypothetical protein